MTIHISHLIHPGTPSQPGEAGTADPAVWHHRIRIGAHVYQTILKSDVISAMPTYEELHVHFQRYPGAWLRVIPTASPTVK